MREPERDRNETSSSAGRAPACGSALEATFDLAAARRSARVIDDFARASTRALRPRHRQPAAASDGKEE